LRRRKRKSPFYGDILEELMNELDGWEWEWNKEKMKEENDEWRNKK
jgi:hypothetical protein